MRDLEEKQPDFRQPLAFTIEGRTFETFDQYKPGAELKKLGGIPFETALFLAVEEGYEAELIHNETMVDLARKDIEHFFVSDKLRFTINGESFISYYQYILGSRIRELGNISDNEDVFLKIELPFKDEFISADENVDLARPGKEHFFSKEKVVDFTIIVNATPKVWKEKTISFEQVVILAFGAINNRPETGYTVTYSRGVELKPEGTMVKGSAVMVKNKMIFDVTATDKS